MSFPPSAFLIGAQKAGTTYLADLLDRQPGIAVSRPKEPHFFSGNRDRGIDWYRACFPDDIAGKVLLDASPSYAAAPLHATGADAARSARSGVPARMAGLVPQARFIYLLRDPVERIHSAYWHNVRAGEESRPFREAVEQDPAYINMSDYLGQARQYLQVFPRERLLFLSFETLRAEPAPLVARCLDFLGIDEPIAVFGEGAQHGGYRPGRVMRALRGAGRAVPLLASAQDALWARTPRRLRRMIKRGLTTPVPALEADDREWLAARFEPDLSELEALTGLELGHWSSSGRAADGAAPTPRQRNAACGG